MSSVDPGIDNIVRCVEIKYKNKGSNHYETIQRSVNRIIVILPVEDINVIE